MVARKRSRKQIRAIKAKAKKPKGFDIWKYQAEAGKHLRVVQKRKKGAGPWKNFNRAERKKLPQHSPFLPEF